MLKRPSRGRGLVTDGFVLRSFFGGLVVAADLMQLHLDARESDVEGRLFMSLICDRLLQGVKAVS